MRKFEMVMVAVVAFGQAACFAGPGGEAAANDSQAMSTGQFAVDSEKQLPTCDPSTEAYIAYIRDEARVLKCESGAWTSHEQGN